LPSLTTFADTYLGWAATGVFVASYFCQRSIVLRVVQMIAALMWVTYGVLIRAPPVIVANVLVFLAAAWSAARESWSARSCSCGRRSSTRVD
jgi:uncharacterized integral membrane protein